MTVIRFASCAICGGVEIAMKKAKEFGIDISQEEIDAQCQKDKKSLDALINCVKSMKKRVVPIDEESD